MNREIAEKTVLVVQQSSFVLDSYLYELKEALEPGEFEEYCRKFGKVMGEALVEILNPLWKEHPDLLPEKMGGSYKTDDEHYRSIQKLIMTQVNERISR